MIQPTGSGESLIIQALPVIFNIMKPPSREKSTVTVISLLVSLMGDQVWFLKSAKITTEFINDIQKGYDTKSGLNKYIKWQINHWKHFLFETIAGHVSGDIYR